MFPSEVSKKLSLSNTSPKDQSLLTLRFPKKLWKIVNECKSGAISWSSDGSAVVIDYTKFQVDYLDNRLDIFKTSNITSFIRQLNLYGFRKVSPHYRVSVGNPENADVHIFRNDSFIRGRPDLLQGVTRKTGALRARMLHHKDDPTQSSSGRSHHVGMDGSRVMQCQGRNFSSRHRQMALRHALEKQHDAFSRLDRHSTTGSSGKPSVKGGASELMEGIPWYSQDSTSETTSSEDDYEYSYDTYRASDDVIKVSNKIKQEQVLENVEAEDCESLLTPKIHSWTGGECGFSVGITEGLVQHQHSHSSSCPSPTLSAAGDMGQLLDPSKSPKVALQHGREGERVRTPPLEDSFTLESVLSRMDKSLSEKIYCILMTEDKKDDSVGMAKEIIGAVGPAQATRVRPPGERIADVVDSAPMAILASWDDDEATGSSQLKSAPGSVPLYYV
ncbi:heat shock transcription factor, X-linked member 4-like [Ornithodoros turicata]|uniref:heat shock transcription factor, X-linked member 4-like n=1 Tax=Ornithodoros turicata TaxID=34597 RepID=UPI003138B745